MSALAHSRRPRWCVDGVADEETHVGRDLLIAAAAGVELEGEVADLLGEFEFDEVVDVFGLFVGRRWSCELGGDGAEALSICEEFFAGEDAGGRDRSGVGDAGPTSWGRRRQSKGKERCHSSNCLFSGSRKRPDHIFAGCCDWTSRCSHLQLGAMHVGCEKSILR